MAPLCDPDRDGPMKMTLRSLAVRALVMVAAASAAAMATIQPQASAGPSAGALTSPATPSGHPGVAAGLPCRVITASPLGVCPPPVAQAASGRQPTLARCPGPARLPPADRTERRLSVCGSGFHPGDLVYVVAIGPTGSTFWRTVPDRLGAFKSALPSPLCRLTPARVVAVSTHDVQSNWLSIARIPCPLG